jgi:hypothetical protein
MSECVYKQDTQHKLWQRLALSTLFYDGKCPSNKSVTGKFLGISEMG